MLFKASPMAQMHQPRSYATGLMENSGKGKWQRLFFYFKQF